MISRVNIIRSTINKRLFSNNSILRSHIGSLPINFNKNNISLDNQTIANNLIIKGELGQLSIKIHPFVNLIYSDPTATTTTTTTTTSTTTSAGPPSDSTLTLSILDPSIKHQRAIWGLTRSLIANAIQGVSNGYSLSLRLVGVGYRATLEPSTTPTLTQRLNLKLGYAHPVLIDLPSDVQASTPSTTVIELKGIDKQRLGEVAARIRRWRVPEPYNVGLV
jgi:large subunit ribosomal protein L6